MIKINKNKAITTYQENIMGVSGILKFIEVEPRQTINGLSYRKDNKKLMVAPMSEEDHEQAQYIKPVLISKTDKIEVGDFKLGYYINDKPADIREVIKIDGNKLYDTETAYHIRDCVDKVIALPEHFSSKHLEDIASGKIKENDELTIKCVFKPVHWMEAVTEEFKPMVELVSDSYIFIL